MNELTHLITDIITIVLLVIISIVFLFSFFMRYKVEKKFEELYFSLFILSIALFLYFDNSVLNTYFFIPVSIDVNIPIVVIICYLIFVFSTLYLMEMNNFKQKDKRFIYYSYIILLVSPVLSCFTILWGVEWFTFFLGLPVLYSFIIFSGMDLIYIGYHIKRSRSYTDIKILYSFIGTFSIATYILSIKFYREILGFDSTPSYYTIIIPIFFFIYLMAKERNEEYSELVELRKLEIDKSEIDIALFKINYKFSEKELLVTQGLCEGKLYKEISDEYDISISYVKKLASSLYKKCGVTNRSELINLGYSLNLKHYVNIS